MNPEDFYSILSQKDDKKVIEEMVAEYLDGIDTEELQGFNTYDDADFFSEIWKIIKTNNLGDLAVKFIKKLMLIKQDAPTKNRFMMGFANNSENTIFNLKFLSMYDKSLINIILEDYTTNDRKELFKAHAKCTGTIGGKININNNKSKKTKRKTKRTTKRKL